jgi:hypothetical protein
MTPRGPARSWSAPAAAHRIAPLCSVQTSQVVEYDRDIGIVGAEGLLPDRQRSLEERFGLGVPSLVIVELSEVSERVGDTEMVGAERFFEDP